MVTNKKLAPLIETKQHQQLIEWNDTKVDYPQDRYIPHLFQAQAARTPHRVAVIAPALSPPGTQATTEITYQELNHRANQLAHHLQKLGVGPEVIVGIFVERSVEMVIGLLGILKAGGAYLPLDPAYPKARLAFMLKDARVSLLLTQQRLAKELPKHQARLLCLDTDWEIIARENPLNPANRLKPGNLAYVIYTSGSTGHPKGVQIPHQALANFLHAMRRQPGLASRDILLSVTTLSFDISALELFLPLIAGARLILASRAVAADGFQLLKQLADSGATVMQATPATWRLLLAAGWQGTGQLKILCGGETLSTGLANQLLARGKCVWNLYGPTEATIWSTIAQVRPGEEPVPIGRPIANTQVYLLNERLQPVPLGQPGELYIGGHGLARGYLNRPALTAEKFIPHPFNPEPGARLYKTGDLARYRPDGQIEFLGRIDHQVKIRGFRVELPEIEAVLRQHPQVQEAVVVAQETRQDSTNKRLVAYIVKNSPNLGPHSQTEPGLKGQVAQWEAVWDETYGQQTRLEDPTFNLNGWYSSYTGRPMPPETVREWVTATVERIRAWQPGRVLEIGCGTGLLLFRIAPDCNKYWATDIAEEAVHFLQQQLAKPGQALPQVKLFQRAADDFRGIEPKSFDAAIINSVIQYFPGIDYLWRVLEGAVAATAPGGIVFVGDVRSLPLLELFHTSVQLHQAPASLTKAQLQQRIHRHMALEDQLLVDPTFFAALKHHLPRISHVQIQLKRGRDHNELTRFRYDVILHLEKDVEWLPVNSWLDWNATGLTLARLRQLLQDTKPQTLGLARLPNARTLAENKTIEWLASTDSPGSVADLRRTLSAISPEAAVDPEDLWALGDDLSYAVQITWSDTGPDGCYDVVLSRRTPGQQPPVGAMFPLMTAGAHPRDWRWYANDPLQAKRARQLIPELRSYLEEKLPNYMLPQAYVLLDRLPLTPNGKVNRQALPAAGLTRAESTNGYVPPRNQLEEILADLWASLLEVEPVGIHDNFFELGGHSILATQLVARLRHAFQVDLPLPALFEAPTIARLAEYIETIRWATQAGPVPAEGGGGEREQGAL